MTKQIEEFEKEELKFEIVYGQKLWKQIEKVWKLEKLQARDVIGIKYKPIKAKEVEKKDITEIKEAPKEEIQQQNTEKTEAVEEKKEKIEEQKEESKKDEIKKEETTEVSKDIKENIEEKKEIAKIVEDNIKLEVKSEEKKAEEKDDKPQIEDLAAKVKTPEAQKKFKLSYEQISALKSCIRSLGEQSISQYKDQISKILRSSSVSESTKVKAKDNKNLKLFYLRNSDNLLLIKGTMMRALERADGQFQIPMNAFCNTPSDTESQILLQLDIQEAKYLLLTMKWRALGELMYRAYSNGVSEFVQSLTESIKSSASEGFIYITVTYLAAKITIDYSLKSLTAEKLYRADPELAEQRDLNELRVFALALDQDIDFLTAIFTKLEEQLWAMSQPLFPSHPLSSLWKECPCKIQSAYARIMTYQDSRESFPPAAKMAEAGLLKTGQKHIVHFEELTTPLEQEIAQSSYSDLWEQLEQQLPESKLIGGKPSANVPLYISLNNFPHSESQLSEDVQISQFDSLPMFLASDSKGQIELWGSKLRLKKLLFCDMSQPIKSIWESYGSQKLLTEEIIKLDIAPSITEDDYGLNSIFAEDETLTQGEISATVLSAKAKISREINSSSHSMMLIHDKIIESSNPIQLATITQEKGTFNQFIRIRQYGYFSSFYNKNFFGAEGVWTNALDDSVYYYQDKTNAMKNFFRNIVNKLCMIEEENIFGLTKEYEFSIEKDSVLAAFATPVPNSTEFAVYIIQQESPEADSIIVRNYSWNFSSLEFKLITATPIKLPSACKKIEFNNNFFLLVTASSILCYSVNDLNLVHEMAIKDLPISAIQLQQSTVIIQNKETITIYELLKNNSLQEESAKPSILTLEKDITPDQLTSVDLSAYGNTEGTIAIGAIGKDNEYSIHSGTFLSDKNEPTKNTWTLLQRQKQTENEFDIILNEAQDLESMEINLEFSKKSLDTEEIDKLSKLLTAEEKKIETEKRKMESEESHLPLVVIWNKGASHNHTVSVSKLLTFDSKEFKSNYPQPEFIFGHQHNKQFIIKKCIIKSPLISGNKCHPIGSGLIYVSNHLSSFKFANHFFTKESQYTAWLEKRKRYNLEIQPYEPAGFFEMNDQSELSFTLNVERPCKYIYLKPTGFRSKPTEIKQFSQFPMSIEYFGVVGTVLESTPQQSAWKTSFDISKLQIPTTASLEIHAFSQSSHTYEKLTTLKNIVLSEFYIASKNLVSKDLFQDSVITKAHILYDEKELRRSLTNKYKLVVSHPSDKTQWEFHSLSIRLFASKKVDRQGELFKSISSSYLWKCVNDPELFSRVNKALCELVCIPERDFNDRIKAMSILRKIMESGSEQMQQVKKHIQLDNFIRANIYQDQTLSFAHKFLQLFQQYPDYQEQINNFAYSELNDLHKWVLKPEALNGFKSILWLVIPKFQEEYLFKLLSKIYEISTKYIESGLGEEHIFLRTRLGVTSYPLSPFAWTAPAGSGKREERTIQNFSTGKKTPASVKLGVIRSGFSCRFILDCEKLFNINTAVLYFKKDPLNMGLNFTVKVYGFPNISEASQVQLFEANYSSHIWERLTEIAYTQENSMFDEKDELDSLILSFPSYPSRYILIDIFLKQGFEGVIENKSQNITEYLKDGILAEAYGISLSKEGKEIKQFSSFFSVDESVKSLKRVGHSATYEKIQHSGTMVDIYKLKIEQQVKKIESKKEKIEQTIGLKLATLQKQLFKEIVKHKENQASKEGILELVSQIEALQRIQCQELSQTKIEGPSCIEYLIQICLEMSGIVTEIIAKNPSLFKKFQKQPTCNINTLIKLLFRNFIVFNSGYPQEEMLSFIQNVLILEITESEWIKMVLEILEDFLSKSYAFYSQKAVIDCLEKFNIPEGELLSFIAKKLKLKENLIKDPYYQQRKRSSSIDQIECVFPELASSLILAIRSLRKLQIEDANIILHRGIICNYCGNNKPIVGHRYKCGHCPNVNICSKSHCIKKHASEFKDHILISIPKPLPYTPNKVAESSSNKVLLPPMKLQHSSKIHEGIECDNCGKKAFEGIRYLCANCDYFNLCEKCYNDAQFSHTKTHVFLRLPEPLIQSETATPKALIPHLDPELYPLQKISVPETELKPPELKRSLTALSERKIEYERLDLDETLQVTYRILIWICHSELMDKKEKTLSLKLCSDLLCILLKVSSVEAIGLLLEEDTQLECIISSYLSIEEDKSLCNSLIKLIQSLKDINIKQMSPEEVKQLSAGERKEYLEKIEKTLSIRSYLSSCLHKILVSLIDKTANTKTLDMNILAMLLNSYIQVLDSISEAKTISNKKEEEIMLPDLSRSLSLPISPNKQEKTKKIIKPSLHLAFGLISFLESFNPMTISSMYGTMWEIVLKILSKIKMQQVIEAKVFERLMSSFFHSSIQIQETIYRQLLNISEKMMQFPNMSTLIINLMKSTLNSTVNTSREEMAFYICRGWLIILLKGTLEKLKENPKPVFAQMDNSDFLDFFYFSSNYLINNLNYGNYSGIQGGKYKLMYRAHLISKMFEIFSKAQVGDSSKLQIVDLIETSQDPRLYNAFNNLIVWLFLNYTENGSAGKIMKLISKTSSSILNIFMNVNKSESLCKSLLSTLQNVVVTGDSQVLKRVDVGELRATLAIELNHNFNKLLKKLIHIILFNTSIANYFAFELKGFDFLFQRLGIDHSSQVKKPGSSSLFTESDLLEGISNTIEAQVNDTEKAEPKNPKVQFNPELIADEDFAKDMHVIECTGETNLSSFHNINWCTYKGGQRSIIYTKRFKDEKVDELVMAFELKKTIEIKEIQLSFNNFWGMDSYDYLDISSVIMEVGTKEKSYNYLCTLEQSHDKSLEVHGVTLFGRNMSSFDEVITKGDPISSKLCSLKNARAKYIRFIIRTGIKVGFTGTQASKGGKQKAVGINYLSIVGYDYSNVSQIQTYLSDKNTKVAYKLLNIFQNKTFRPCLKEFAVNSVIINQLKMNFHSLASMMTTDKTTIEPFLIALCTHNSELGKWILQELIKSRENKGSALFMIQICMCNFDQYNESQNLILSYILGELNQLDSKLSENTEEPQGLSQIILQYISLLYLASPKLDKDILLNIKESDIVLIFKLTLQYWEHSEVREVFIKLLIVLMKPPIHIVTPVDMNSIAAKYLLASKDQRSLLITSFLSPYDKSLANKLLKMIPIEFNMQNEQLAIEHLSILLNLTLDLETKNTLAENKLPLMVYEKLKNPADKITYMHPVSDSLLTLSYELIKSSLLGYSENEKKLTEAMINDFEVIKSIENKTALSKFILNLMRAEKTIPICLYNYDSECEQYKSLAADDTLRKNKKKTFFLDTALLLPKHKELLVNMLKERFGVESEAERLFASNWKQVFKEHGNPPQNSADRFKTFIESVSGKGPFIVFMSGMSEGKRVVVGGFSMTTFPVKPTTLQNGQTLEIKSCPESLFFYYSESKLHHFELKNKGENFGYIYIDYANCGACVLGNYFLSFSYSYSYSNSVGSLSSLKCIDGNITNLPFNFIVETVEIWACDQEAVADTDTSDKDLITPLTKISANEHAWYSAKSPFQYFRANAVFNVPSHISVKELSECIIGKSSVNLRFRNTKEVLDPSAQIGKIFENNIALLSSGILDIEFEMSKDSKELAYKTGYKPENTILEHFEALGGYLSLIDAAKSNLTNWKNTNLSRMFQLYLEELLQFSKLAEFFKTLLNNKRSKIFLFEIMAGTPEKDTSGKSKKEIEAKERKWEDEYNISVTYCYTIISQLFANPTNLEIRTQACNSDFIPMILARLGKLTGENPRQWSEELVQNKEVDVKSTSADQTEDPTKKKVRKGVGYSTAVGEIWDVDKYLKSKKAKNSQIIALATILSNFISCDQWEPNPEFIKNLCESALLPSLENSLASGSLLEMAKEHELIQCYLDLIDKFRDKPILASLLVEIDKHYIPPQREPIYKVLKNINEISNIFIRCLEKEKELKPENEVPRLLAEKIQSCYKKVMRVVEKMLKERNSDEMKNILSLPLPEAYKALLRDLRFGYTNMTDEKGKYKHFYSSHADQEKSASQNKLIRLAQELADLSNALPEDHTNAIFIRVDEQRIDYMKAIVMGASGTPYAHGAFEYDIYCPANYPNESPKMNLTTTGNNSVRFNPNLYHDGKVCLSLLGTWRGTATENWDPKVSTILQVLMSLQAIVMSEEVYFNEPGFEGEIGRPEGEKKNEAYSNIVRYANLKFAMLGQIKNPPKGFESVIKRHFYLKKDEILKDAKKWIENAEKHEASYEGLVYDHNSEWCNKFKQSKTKYKEMLIELVKELETTLASIEPPQEISEKSEGDAAKGQVNESGALAFAGGESIEGVDIAEDTVEELEKKLKDKEDKLNVDDAGFKDRWSRYIGAVGMDAVAKQNKSLVFLSGAGGLGIEIAKNVVLSGCKEFTIQDTKKVELTDLSSQFFLRESDIGKNRAEACKNRLQELNYYVKVNALSSVIPDSEAELEANNFKKYTAIILTECSYKTQCLMNSFCRKNKIPLIIGEVRGTVCKILNDFGEVFSVYDIDGEEPKECMIKEITNAEKGEVTTITGQRHGFENGDLIVLKEVEGMELSKEQKEEIKAGDIPTVSINDTVHTVVYVDPYKFKIGDTRGFSKYIRNGVAKQIKIQKELAFKDLNTVYASKEICIDKNLDLMDFAKIQDRYVTHISFEALDTFITTFQKMPEEWNLSDAEKFASISEKIADRFGQALSAKEIDFVKYFSCTAKISFSPLCSFIGGIISQELFKAITGKYLPINQIMYYNIQELLPQVDFSNFAETKSSLGLEAKSDRYDHVRLLLGTPVFERLSDYKLFLIGVGAIGCELLKNYAMLGIGHKSGKILMTDPDVIEVSNLNRQFLFKEKHIRKPKSITAAASIIQMNPTLKDKIIARIDKVHEPTAYIFTNDFFAELSAVTNALDNVQARRYIDSRCVSNKIPLFESGTLGTKGHVQVIIPYKTESYSSQNDPEESTDIPVCTLKMFPEEIVHCIEWARDKFEKIFAQKPKIVQKYVEITEEITVPSPEEIKSLKSAIKILTKKPSNFNDCVAIARLKFQKYFVNDAKQLLYVYPIETTTKDGSRFWTLPKRPPHELKFNPENGVHSHFIMAYAALLAKIWGIGLPENLRSEEVKLKYAKIAATTPVPEYKPNDKKAKAIHAEVEKADEEEKVETHEDETQPLEQVMEKLLDELDLKLSDMAVEGMIISPQEFEKDNDLNFHIDFIYAMANCRAETYSIAGNSWIDTKIKAGRIIPALASTTAVVAALQTLELVKLAKQTSIENHRNAFVNLALPSISLSEPAPPKKTTLTPELNVTLWDRWEVKVEKGPEATFEELLLLLKSIYKLEPKDFFKGNKPLYLDAVMAPAAKAKFLKSLLDDALDLNGGEKFVDLTITFTKSGETKLLEGIPPVRLFLN